jgi:GT2 family glycosyltransferase
MNDVISGMLNVYMKYPKTGTVGARLHFENNTIQHEGILSVINQHGKYHVTHVSLNSYYPKNNGVNKVSGNTGALLMIRHSTFKSIGGFNENYRACFEDVELNYKCVCLGLENYCNSDVVAYHYEIQTRKEDPDDMKKLTQDYSETLLPFFTNNIKKLSTVTTHVRV